MKRFIAILLMFAASCGFEVARDPSILSSLLNADPPTLNPVLGIDLNSFTVGKYVYESLLDLDNETLELKPKLAKAWEISPDHLTYVFWLRSDVKWHDGSSFGADDVVYTFEKIRDPKVDAPHLRGYFKELERIEKISEYAVKFKFKKPYFKALEILSGAMIIPKHIFERSQDFNADVSNRSPIGTGPFKFAEWKTGRHIKLVRNDDYWGMMPELAGITFKIVSDQTVAFWLLKKGGLDLSAMRAIQWVRQTDTSAFKDQFRKYRYYLPNCSFFAWNMRRPFFSDRRVRIAMTMLINRQKILDKILLGQGEVVSSDFYRFGKFYNDVIKPYPYDPQKAGMMLDEAGWSDHDGDGLRDKDGEPFRFTLVMAGGDKLSRSIGLFFKEELSKVGIDLEVEQMEWAAMLMRISRRDFDAVSIGRASPLNQDPYQVWHSTQSESGSNYVGFENREADKIMEEARLEFDESKRRAMYFKLQEIIHDEEPCTYLFTTPSFVAVAKRFENVKLYRLGLDPLEWKVGPWPVLIEW